MYLQTIYHINYYYYYYFSPPAQSHGREIYYYSFRVLTGCPYTSQLQAHKKNLRRLLVQDFYGLEAITVIQPTLPKYRYGMV